MNRPSSKLAAG